MLNTGMTALQDALRACDNNQSELARRLGTKRANVNQWIKREKVPSWWYPAVLEMAKGHRETRS